MKTKQEIELKIKELDEKRIKAIHQRDTAVNELNHNVGHNLVVTYVMQQEILNWVLTE